MTGDRSGPTNTAMVRLGVAIVATTNNTSSSTTNNSIGTTRNDGGTTGDSDCNTGDTRSPTTDDGNSKPHKNTDLKKS